MPNTYFRFREFNVEMRQSGLKVTTDACLFGAWVASQLAETNQVPISLLDIGTGTGLLSLMVAQKLPKASIYAVEKQEAAAKEAAENFENSPWKKQLTCINQSIQNFLPDRTFDVIFSNPPFFSNHYAGKSSEKNVALHDQSLPMSDLIASMVIHLSPTGKFFVLYPEREMLLFIAMAGDSGFFINDLVIVRNTSSAKTFRIMACFSRRSLLKKESEIIIKDSQGAYTTEFWELLSPYYLAYNAPSQS